MINVKALVLSAGLMVGNMLVNGKQGNNMVMEHISVLKVKENQDFGRMVRK